jgi:DNA-binding response OmpR family regulator
MKNIIHVDNSEFFRKQMRTFLQAEGFEVEGFDSAQEANLSIGAGGADIVVMGLAFADIDGKDFVRKTMETFSGPVFVVSSSVDKILEHELHDMGVMAACSKTDAWKDILRPHLLALKEK